MKQERILVWKDEALYNKVNHQYAFVHESLKELVSGIKKFGYNPTVESIRALLDGEDLSQQITKVNHSAFSETFKHFPEGMKKAIHEMFASESKAEYNENVGRKAKALAHFIYHSNNCYVDMDYFSLVDGEVILSPEYISSLEKAFCVFVDSPHKQEVYNKWLKLKEAEKEFKDSVMKAPKREPTQVEKAACVSGEFLTSLDLAERFSMAALGYNGELVLNGENFNWIK